MVELSVEYPVMAIEPLIKDLLDAGVHFGHQTHRWNPKMKRFIFGEKNGIYLVDLEQTAKGLTEAQDFVRSVAAQGGSVLFVGTKRQAQSIIKAQATRCGQYYINLRWLGGLLTNFQTILKSVGRLKMIREWKVDGTMDKMKKKEASNYDKKLLKLEKVLLGILEMKHLPKAVIIVDAKREDTAIKEANRLGIPLVALADTNCNPDPIEYIIPGNDDAIRSIQLILSKLADAILEGSAIHHKGVEAKAAEKAAHKAAERAQADSAKSDAQPQEVTER